MIDVDVQKVVAATLPQLVALGRRRGFLLERDIRDRLSELDVDPDLIETISRHLDAADIEVLAGEAPRRPAAQRPFGESIAGLEGIDDDDSVSLYFRERSHGFLALRDERLCACGIF